jgi:hypothetical protein
MRELQVILTYFTPSPKQNDFNSWEVEPSALTDAMTLGTDKAETTFPQRASTFKAVLGSATRTGQVNLEKDSGCDTGCGRNNSHVLKGNKNQTKQGTKKFFYL